MRRDATIPALIPEVFCLGEADRAACAARLSSGPGRPLADWSAEAAEALLAAEGADRLYIVLYCPLGLCLERGHDAGRPPEETLQHWAAEIRALLTVQRRARRHMVLVDETTFLTAPSGMLGAALAQRGAGGLGLADPAPRDEELSVPCLLALQMLRQSPQLQALDSELSGASLLGGTTGTATAAIGQSLAAHAARRDAHRAVETQLAETAWHLRRAEAELGARAAAQQALAQDCAALQGERDMQSAEIARLTEQLAAAPQDGDAAARAALEDRLRQQTAQAVQARAQHDSEQRLLLDHMAELQQDHDRLSATVHQLRAALADSSRALETQAAEARRTTARQDKSAADLGARLRAAEDSARRAREEAAAQEAALRAELTAFEAEFNKLVQSRSWKLTAPLRMLNTLYHRLSGPR